MWSGNTRGIYSWYYLANKQMPITNKNNGNFVLRIIGESNSSCDGEKTTKAVVNTDGCDTGLLSANDGRVCDWPSSGANRQWGSSAILSSVSNYTGSMLVSYLDGDHKHFLLVLHLLRWFVLDFEIHLQNIFSIICSLNWSFLEMWLSRYISLSYPISLVIGYQFSTSKVR